MQQAENGLTTEEIAEIAEENGLTGEKLAAVVVKVNELLDAIFKWANSHTNTSGPLNEAASRDERTSE